MPEEGNDRRIFDQDHDLLVKLVTDVGHLCKKYDKNHEEVRQDMKEIHNRIDQQAAGCLATHVMCNSFFVPRYVFYWAVVLCFIAVTFVGGVAIDNRAKISEHQGYSQKADERVNDRIDSLRDSKLYIEDTLDTLE
jgi:hypothetical protein